MILGNRHHAKSAVSVSILLAMRFIELRGVRVHNLKNVDLRLPLGQLIAITGVSGAGKSSLAFDTLVAEGRRRYIETFAPAARQFLERIERPDADALDQLPPAMAFRAESTTGLQTTLGSVTETDDLLRTLFARLGRAVCPKCTSPLSARSAEQVATDVATLPEGTRFVIAFPNRNDAGRNELKTGSLHYGDWRSRGFVRGLSAIESGPTWQATSIELTSESASDPALWVIVDRLVTGKVDPARLLESLELALQHGQDQCAVLWESTVDRLETGLPGEWDGRRWQRTRFSRRLACVNCDIEFPPLEPDLFNFESSLGACSQCHGTGVIETKGSRRRDVESAACSTCGGSRLSEFGRNVTLGDATTGRKIVELRALSLNELSDFVRRRSREALEPGELSEHSRARLRPDGGSQSVSGNLFAELSARLRQLEELGLQHLSLGRSLRTLSRGERQRARLAGLLATRLDNAMYVLDEPSGGLHESELPLVLTALRRLQQAGNTVIVVEHHPALIAAADYVVDLGPRAGRYGGEVVFAGSPTELIQFDASQTGRWLKSHGVRAVESPPAGSPGTSVPALRFTGVTLHNLKNLSIEFPLGGLCALTGVSGVGKSSLVEHTIFPALCQRFGKSCDVEPVGEFDELTGAEQLDDVVFVNSSPLRKSARANAATLLHLFSELRRLFAESTEAKVRNLSARHFSFNAPDSGRCPRCRGLGAVEIDMQFLANLTAICPECHGSRYQSDVLDAKLRGLSIAEVLNLSADEAFAFFRGQPLIQRRLKVLKDVGLGYLPLGQSAATLSRGECQRLKLAGHLASRSKSRTLFLLDEPTVGLHPTDVVVLLGCLRRLIDVGHSVIAIEHRRDFLDHVDWQIELTTNFDSRSLP